MEVRKEAGINAGTVPDENDLELISTWSRRPLTAEEVYIFSLRLCDNEIDRDWERFSPTALEELAGRFVGKSGIFDHDWSAGKQTARIYRAEVVTESGVTTAAGDESRYVKAWAYLLRTEANRNLIAEIEGGIKKEISVGCAVARSICSICGNDINDRELCHHMKGRTYNQKLCWAELDGVTDAYEWSFVAVPAQRNAGVLKKSYSGMELKTALAGNGPLLEQLKSLEHEAELGRRYLSGLRREVVRLGCLAEKNLDTGTLETIAGKLDELELKALRKSFQQRAEDRYPGGVQLTYRTEAQESTAGDGDYQI